MKKRFFAVILSVIIVFSALVPVCCAQEDAGAVKNIIVMIGDGMGENHLEWTKAVCNVKLNMDSLPYQGYSQTNSLSGTTDSAAGGTALSSGRRTFNGNIGEMGFQIGDYDCMIAKFMNTAEIAKSLGKRAGVLTSDTNSGATPAAFSAHTADRGSDEDITNQQLAGNLDLMWAAANGRVTEEIAVANGWKYVDTLMDAYALKTGTKTFGAFNGMIQYDDGNKSCAPLSQLTTLAIKQLDCEEGFFLMVEGAHIDKYSHNNDYEGMMKSLIEFDKAVGEAVKFAENDGNTIVIVTADHETGKIVYDSDEGYKYTQTSHSNTDVPLRIYGTDKLVKDGAATKNYNVSRFTAEQFGYAGEYPVCEYNVTIVFDIFSAIGKAFIDLFK